jgi:hypothetical protein
MSYGVAERKGDHHYAHSDKVGTNLRQLLEGRKEVSLERNASKDKLGRIGLRKVHHQGAIEASVKWDLEVPPE